MVLTNVLMLPARYVFIIHAFDEKGGGCAARLAEVLGLMKIATVTGKDLCGRPVSVEVRKRLKSAAVAVAIITPDPDNAGRPSAWTLQELAIALDNSVPCILVVEGGLVFDPGIAGDLEQIRFPPGDFRSVDVRVAWQVDALMNLAVDIPSEVPACPPDVRVRLLNLEGREYGRLGRWADVKRVSDEALRLDPKATSAAINKGVALVHLGYFADAEGLFMQIPAEFNNADDSQLSKVHQNLAWVKRVRDAGSLEPESLREQVMHLKESLTLDPRNVYARAYLLLCRVALGELEEARALLMESLNDWDRFLKALDKVVEAWGGAGHRLLGRLPDALYSLLFPARKDDDDDDDGCGPLAA